MTDDGFTAEERRWLKTWGEKTEKVAAGELTPEDVCEWVWRDRVLNAINVTVQRIKRSERPGMDPRRTDNTWVTLAAEVGTKKEEIGVLALQVLVVVFDRLKARGHEFDVDWMPTAHGVVVLSVNIKSLRVFMERRASERGKD